jgi:hypothetical protein
MGSDRPRTVLEGVDFRDLCAKSETLEAELERYKALYVQAVLGRQEMRAALRSERRTDADG